MKHIYVNLKRFDIPRAFGGVNDIAKIDAWGGYVIEHVQEPLKQYAKECTFTFFLPEMHLLTALEKRAEDGVLKIGCQGVCAEDVEKGGNFGAFTTSLPAAAAKAAGCTQVLIGHCEERKKIAYVLKEAGINAPEVVSRILNKEIQRAVNQGLEVLYCIGEKSEEVEQWNEILGMQLRIGLEGVDRSSVVIAYEPIWSIGPGKVPADKEYITKVARFVKEQAAGIRVVYGGGLKKENAGMLAEIEEIDGGLIALTRFQGEIGFYPEEYLEIVDLYLNEKRRLK